LKKIKVKIFEPDYIDDCKRIQRVFAEHDLEITMDQAQFIWGEHSGYVCASWLIMPDSDEELFDELKKYYEIIDEEDGPWQAGAIGLIPKDDGLVWRDDAVFGKQFYALNNKEAQIAADILNRLETIKQPKSDNNSKCQGCDGSGWQCDREGFREGFICDFCDAACICGKARDPKCLVHKNFP
jgi:hypothetical protein